MKTPEQVTATSELARAARLRRMSADLLKEARDIEARFAKPRKQNTCDAVALLKSVGCRQ